MEDKLKKLYVLAGLETPHCPLGGDAQGEVGLGISVPVTQTVAENGWMNGCGYHKQS